ncbi:MAG: phosphoribosyl-ATP diphosphatase, partial [Pseudomonadales bacterium]
MTTNKADRNVLQELDQVLEARKGEDAQTSYVASLYAKGTNKILEKVGEEATEVILAAKDLDAQSDPHKRAALA